MKTLAFILLSLPVFAAAATDGQWKERDYDALFALLQKYRDQLRGLRLADSDLERQLEAFKTEAADLRARLKVLHPLDGLKIHGRLLTTFDDLLLTGGTALRHRQALQRAKLEFSLTRGPVSGSVDWEFMALMGSSYFVSGGARRLNIELRLPVSLEAGDFYAKFSPLTLWRNEDPEPFEVEPFTTTRRRLREETRLRDDHAWLLRGARVSSDVELFNSLTVAAKIIFTQLGGSNPVARTTGLVYQEPGFDRYTVYNTYLLAWSAQALVSSGMEVAYLGTKIWDATDSSSKTYTIFHDAQMLGQPIRGFDSQVHSARLHWDSGGLSLDGEAALSLYSNPNLPALYDHEVTGRSGYLTGTAWTLEAAYKAGAFHLKIHGRQAGSGFVSAPAQGRTHDARLASYGPFFTDNTIFDPSTGRFDTLPLPLPAETHFNHRILPPQMTTASGFFAFDYLLPYDQALNAASPYGPATPNRLGGGADLGLKLWKGLLEPRVFVDSAQQDQPEYGRPKISFLGLGYGLALDLRPLLAWPLALKAGLRTQDVSDGANIGFGSAVLHTGLEWELSQAWTLQLGYRHLDVAGNLEYRGSNAYLLAFGGEPAEAVYDQFAYALLWKLSPEVRLSLDYRNLLAGTFRVDQAYAGLELLF